MGKSLAALLNKKHNPDDGIKKFSWFHSCSKLSAVREPVKRNLAKKEESSSDSANQESIAHLPAVENTKDDLFWIAHPAEPVEVDCPIRCPQPEPGIVHDGRILKERLQISIKMRGELMFLKESEYQSLKQRRPHLLNDGLIFTSASAPEPSICHFLE